MIGWGVLGIVAWIIIAIWPARIASKKGHSFILWFFISISFWWITLFWVNFGLKDRNRTAQDIANEQAVDKILEKEENQK